MFDGFADISRQCSRFSPYGQAPFKDQYLARMEREQMVWRQIEAEEEREEKMRGRGRGRSSELTMKSDGQDVGTKWTEEAGKIEMVGGKVDEDGEVGEVLWD